MKLSFRRRPRPAPDGAQDAKDAAIAAIREYRANPLRYARDVQGRNVALRGKVITVLPDGRVTVARSDIYGVALQARYADPDYAADLQPGQKVALRGAMGAVKRKHSRNHRGDVYDDLIVTDCAPLPAETTA